MGMPNHNGVTYSITNSTLIPLTTGTLDAIALDSKSTSGSLEVTYPREWTGTVDVTSLSGALHLHGKDLQLPTEDNHH